jgi:hypothetical protein
MKKRELQPDTTGATEKRTYTRLRFPREIRRDRPILVGLAKTLAVMQKKSGLKKPEYAKTLGISGAAFRMLRNCSANPKLDPLFEMSIRLQIPLCALCGAEEVRGRLIATDHALKHMALVISEMTATVGATDADKSKFLGISLLQFYLIRRLEASPPLLVCEEMAGRLGISVWEFLGVDANTPLRTD